MDKVFAIMGIVIIRIIDTLIVHHFTSCCTNAIILVVTRIHDLNCNLAVWEDLTHFSAVVTMIAPVAWLWRHCRYVATCRSWLGNLTTPYASTSIEKGNHSDAVLNASRDVLTVTVTNNNVTVPAYDFAFFVSSTALLNNSAVLNLLVHENRTALAPKLTRSGKYFSNFWGSTLGGQFAQCYDDDSDCLGYVQKKLCTEGDYVDWMKTNCARSCGMLAFP